MLRQRGRRELLRDARRHLLTAARSPPRRSCGPSSLSISKSSSTAAAETRRCGMLAPAQRETHRHRTAVPPAGQRRRPDATDVASSQRFPTRATFARMARRAPDAEAPTAHSRAARLLLGSGLLLGLVIRSRAAASNGAPPAPHVDPPPFPIGGPKSTAWREEALTKAQELWGLASWIQANRTAAPSPGQLPVAISNQLKTAQDIAAGQ